MNLPVLINDFKPSCRFVMALGTSWDRCVCTFMTSSSLALTVCMLAAVEASVAKYPANKPYFCSRSSIMVGSSGPLVADRVDTSMMGTSGADLRINLKIEGQRQRQVGREGGTRQ